MSLVESEVSPALDQPSLELIVEQNKAVLLRIDEQQETLGLKLRTDDHEILQRYDLSAGVQMKNSRLIGGRDSKHNVFAVELVADDGNDEMPPTLVVKPQMDRPYRADTEFSILRKVQQMGFLALSPVAIAAEPNRSTRYLITEYMPNLHVYTELAWRDGYLGSELNETTLVPAIQEAAAFFHSMHFSGVTHGDAQLKNIARLHTGEFVLLDLENGEFHEKRDESWAKSVAGDFKSFVSSLWHLGYLQFSTPETFSQELSTHFYDIYLDLMDQHSATDEEMESITEGFDAAIRHAQQIIRPVKVAA